MMQRIHRAGDDDVSATVTSREGDVAVAHWSVHVGVCGTWDSVVVSYRGCYRDLQWGFTTGDATDTSRWV